MCSNQKIKLTSIACACGWKVQYMDCHDLEPLACWGLFENENGDTEVHGLIANIDGEVENCENNEYFLDYVAPDK